MKVFFYTFGMIIEKLISKRKTMKTVLGLLLLFICQTYSYAQAPDYDDLKILYADAKYEKLVAAADKYSQKEDLKKDPYPLMWLAKGLYKISLTGTDDEKYKNAYKDAIGAMAKCFKIDKDSSCFNTHREFVDEFQMSLVERVSNAVSQDKPKDAATWATKFYKITTHIIGPKYIEAAAKYRAADKGGAAALWKECDKLMEGITEIESWTIADKHLFRIGVLMTADCFVAARQKEKAVELLNKVAQWFEEDPDFKARYDEIVN